MQGLKAESDHDASHATDNNFLFSVFSATSVVKLPHMINSAGTFKSRNSSKNLRKREPGFTGLSFIAPARHQLRDSSITSPADQSD